MRVERWRWFRVGQRVEYRNWAWECRGYVGPRRTGDRGVIRTILRGALGALTNIVVDWEDGRRDVCPWAKLRTVKGE